MKEILLAFSGKVVQVSSLNSIRNADHLIHAMDVKQYDIIWIGTDKKRIEKERFKMSYYFFRKRLFISHCSL